jgi:carboxyl-terminal processing protease
MLAAAVSLCAACGAIVGPDVSTGWAALFDRVWGDVDMHYSFFVQKQVDWDSLRAKYRPLVLVAEGDEEVSGLIQDMLANLHDDHVLFRGVQAGYTPGATGGDPTLPFGKYTAFGAKFSGPVSYGTAGTSIGYILIDNFEGNGWLGDIDSALTAMHGASAVIVDVRNNRGGYLENATGAAGRFAGRTTTVAYARYRNGRAHTDFSAPIAQQVTPAGPRRFLGRVFVLTSRSTVSAAEIFVLSMRMLGHTIVVGDTTAGATGSPFARELQNGWSYQFPESIEFTIDGRTFEDIGLPPDEYVPNNTDLLRAQGIDLALARAISLARQHP